MSRKILMITYLFIVALFVTNSAIAQNLTVDRPSVQISLGGEEQVNVTLYLEGNEFMYWDAPIIETGKDKVQVSFDDLMGGMSTLSNDRRNRRLGIRALIAGVATILVKVCIKKNGIVDFLQVIIAVLVNEVFSPQEIPVIEQGVLAIDYFAIKED